MKKIIVFGASNSKNSINKTLAIYTANKIKNVEVDLIDLNDFELPFYGIDFETESGIPENAITLNNLLQQTDGFVISLAEHNVSYTAFFKNTLDWLSRVDIKVWKNKPMLLLATSPGARGAKGVLETAKSFFPHIGGNIIADFSLPSFYDNFSENKILENELKKELSQKIQLFEHALQKI